MAVSSGCCHPKLFPVATDCRGDSGALPRPEINSTAASSRLLSPRCRASGLSSALILRFPPNFVRQLSTKARRNCSNIGVAQIVAASWSNNSSLPETPLSASAAAAADAAATLAITVEADVASAVGGDATSAQSQISAADSKAAAIAALLSSDGSLAVHAGERLGRVITTDAITTPVVNTSAYWFKDSNQLIDFKERRHASFEYGRYGNPTTRALEEKMSALEKAESTLFVSSGMYASVAMLTALVPAGGHIVTTTDCYRKTRVFIQKELPKMGISELGWCDDVTFQRFSHCQNSHVAWTCGVT